MNGFFLVLLFFTCLYHGAAAQEAGIAPGTDLAGIMGKPAIVRSAVSMETGAGGEKWIQMDADVHVCTNFTLDELRPVARDFANYANIFKRMKWTKVIEKGGSVYLEMFISVGLMGITYDADYTLLAAELVDTPSRFLLDFSHYADDGRIKDAHGIWYFESVTVNGKAAVYMRYIASGKVLKKFPLQDTIMDIFVDMEHIDMLNQVLRAVRKMQSSLHGAPVRQGAEALSFYIP
jgi:hypothetical protein